MKQFQSLIRTVAVAAGLSVAGLAQAELVTNGGFETGSFSGWTQFGNTGFTGVDTSSDHAGVFGSAYGPVGSSGGVFQSLATVVGQTYTVSFWLANTGGATNSFGFNWGGGADELALTNAATFGYAQHSFQLTATGTTTDLRFTFRHDPSWWWLDDVSVVANQAAVPEPASLALVGLALLGAIGVTRRA